MARLANSLKQAIQKDLQGESESEILHQIKQYFQESLHWQVDKSGFADMYAQTVVYGLFAARVSHAQISKSQPFDCKTAGTYFLTVNPCLPGLLRTITETALSSHIHLIIQEIVQFFAEVDIEEILNEFQIRTPEKDPIIHFYENFLVAYNSSLRKIRGVYYTPDSIVSFIVRSVDAILKNQFNLPLGLADCSTNSETQKPRVQILDPAAGTGTFLSEVINQIYHNLEAMGIAGTWNQYVRENLLSRLFGFELLLAPFVIAHLKLGLQLQNFGYQFTDQQPVNFYLSNTLDEVFKKSNVFSIKLF